MSHDPQKSAIEKLKTPAQFVKGVGPRRAELLNRLGLRTAADLLFCFPRDYFDASQLREIDGLTEGEPASVWGVVEEMDARNTGVGRSMLGVLIRCGDGYLRAIWFNQPYMQERFYRGARVLLSGTPRLRGGRWEMVHPRVDNLGQDDQPPVGRIEPIYPLTEGLRQPAMRRLIQGVVDEYAGLVEEVFPPDFLQTHQLLPVEQALLTIHAPANPDQLEAARRRFIYQELLVLQLALALRRKQLAEEYQAPQLPLDSRIDARIRRLFAFPLTADQDTAVAEIVDDLNRSTPMNRLLQGDVGSGKTVVAEYAMLLTVARGFQAAIMTPTEVLARQHERTLNRDLHASRVRIGLLVGSLSAAQRRDTLKKIESGEIDLVVGTHSLLNDEVRFPKLALAIIDEQHKFGVRQRAAFRRSGTAPHYLVMTATPIPRTVSMTIFGDLDVSVLRETPPGRSTVHTYLGEESQREQWWSFFRKKLDEGRQGYVIAPLVEESTEAEQLGSVQQSFESLANGELEAYRLGLVHGRMQASDKDQTMQAFQRGDIQVLLATSVVEVGVNVPNATIMTIENAERFGLAQLHQLRGRISRGMHAGYLCAFADAKTDEARQRLEAFRDSNDGFALAEMDFELRGPGQIFGSRQHGLPPFRIADLGRDANILEETRADARTLINRSDGWESPAWERMRAMVLRRYGKALELGDVG